jgi:hypothetical protein
MRVPSARSDRGLIRLFFVLVAVPMFAVFPYLRDLNNPNEYARVFTTMMLVEKGTFIIDEPVATYGWINDMAHTPGLDPTKTPHYTMVKAPGATYLGIPGYFVFSKIVAPLLGHERYATPQSTNEDMGKPPRVPSKLARFHAFGKRRPKRSAAGCMPTAPREQTDRNDV